MKFVMNLPSMPCGDIKTRRAQGINGRFITNVMIKCYNNEGILQYNKTNSICIITSMLVLVDIEKAFDNISWDYINLVLGMYTFGPESCSTLINDGQFQSCLSGKVAVTIEYCHHSVLDKATGHHKWRMANTPCRMHERRYNYNMGFR